ncbi:MAG: hypothetical protein WAM60_16490 [Candidatus Promineifilaceae bacterium]
MVSQNEKEIERILHQFDPQTANQIRPIIYDNMDRGRIAAFLANDEHTLEQYIYTVADNYNSLAGRLYQLQIVHSQEHWQPLIAQIQRWLGALFMRKGFLIHEVRALIKQSAECTALDILSLPYPYDVDFDVWVMVITERNSRRLLIRQGRELVGS